MALLKPQFTRLLRLRLTVAMLLFGLPKYQIDKLRLVLNTAARVVTLARKYDHINPVMQTLHLLPVSQRITFKIGLLIYKALNGLARISLSNLLAPRCYARSVTQILFSGAINCSEIQNFDLRRKGVFHCQTKALELNCQFPLERLPTSMPLKVRNNGQQKSCNLSCNNAAKRVAYELNSDVTCFTTNIKPVLQQLRFLTGLNEGGKTSNIAFQLVQQQICKTSCMFF